MQEDIGSYWSIQELSPDNLQVGWADPWRDWYGLLQTLSELIWGNYCVEASSELSLIHRNIKKGQENHFKRKLIII